MGLNFGIFPRNTGDKRQNPKTDGVLPMIILDLTPQEQQQLEAMSQQAGVSIQQFIRDLLFPPVKNTMLARVEALPQPTSYPQDAVELQRQWRDEWD